MRITCSQVCIEPNKYCSEVCRMYKHCGAYKTWVKQQENKFPNDFQPDPEANVFHETFGKQNQDKKEDINLKLIAVWAATAVAVAVGMIVTKSPLCLGVFLVPLLATMVIELK